MNPERKAVILVADDSEFDRMVLKRAFAAAKIDAELVFVSDGEALLECLRAMGADASSDRKPGIVLLDLRMPRMDGREALRAIREDPGLRHQPIVILTTSDSEKHVREFYALGANSYVVKPNNFDDVVRTVRDLQHYWFGTARLPQDAEVDSRPSSAQGGRVR